MGVSNTLIRGLTTIGGILNKENIEYCLVSGLAVSMLATPRATEDIDLLVVIDDSERADFLKLLSSKFDVIQSSEMLKFTNLNMWRIVLCEKNVV